MGYISHRFVPWAQTYSAVLWPHHNAAALGAHCARPGSAQASIRAVLKARQVRVPIQGRRCAVAFGGGGWHRPALLGNAHGFAARFAACAGYRNRPSSWKTPRPDTASAAQARAGPAARLVLFWLGNGLVSSAISTALAYPMSSVCNTMKHERNGNQ